MVLQLSSISHPVNGWIAHEECYKPNIDISCEYAENTKRRLLQFQYTSKCYANAFNAKSQLKVRFKSLDILNLVTKIYL